MFILSRYVISERRASDMQEQVHTFALCADGDGPAAGPRLNGKRFEVLLISVNKPPATEQFHVVPVWIRRIEISHHYFAIRLTETGKAGPLRPGTCFRRGCAGRKKSQKNTLTRQELKPA